MKRTLALGAAWTAAAGVAVGLGFLAVSLVDASASPGTTPASAAAPATVAAPSSAPAATPTGTPSAPPADQVPGASAEQVTVGGTVYASCDAGRPVLAGAPAPGWWVDDPSRPDEVEFENGSSKVEVAVSCADGNPAFFLEGPRGDDGRREDGSRSSSPSSASSSPSSSSYDDSDGRRGGGHGSDDGPGDDSSGRGGGGHGSDD